jgi:hypothetical protein
MGLVVCMCVCAMFLVEWPRFILSGGSVLYWSVGVCPFSGLWGGGIMAGGSLKGCQRLRWGIWYGRRLGCCWLWIRRECEIAQLCWCGLLFCGIAQHLHSVVSGAERMCFFIKVFCKARCMAIVLEGLLVFVISYIEASSSLSHIRLLAFRAGEFLHSG